MNVLERTSSEKQSANLAQQQRDAANAKNLQNQQQNSKNPPSRKSREGRSRSQDWPDVPDIGKIQENNPEILAQKILETGRQIEAGRISSKPSANSLNSSNTRSRLPQATLSFSSPPPSTLSQTSSKESTSRIQEPPRVANFEDRLKSIITSVLNEDQQNRNKQQQIQMQQSQQPAEPDRKRLALTPNVSAPDYTQVRNIFKL